MESSRRKANIRARLKRGDLKKLSEELNMSYSYLSQAFSPGSKFAFTDELARKVEEKMGWPMGALDESSEYNLSNVVSPLLFVANKYRAEQFQKLYPRKSIEAPYHLQVMDINKSADIAIINEDNSFFAVGNLCEQLSHAGNVGDVILLMALTGAEYGFLYAPSSGVDPSDQSDQRYFEEKRMSRWFCLKSGKVEEIPTGPSEVFKAVGI